MLSKNDIINLQNKYNVSPTKRFGQNFLVDHNILNKIVNFTDLTNKDIVEIGPGLGSLTIPLLEKSKSVTSYEIDNEMIKVLESEITSDKFLLVKGDFLDSIFEWKNKRDIIANIPYNITSPILFKILKNEKYFNSATLMVQKEFGERVLAKVKTKAYSKLSVSIQTFCKVEKVTDVSRECFLPSPKVDSIVFKITFKKPIDNSFLKFVKLCFSQKRKTLVNNLKNYYSKDVILSILKKLNLKDNIRPQEIEVETFTNLFNLFK